MIPSKPPIFIVGPPRSGTTLLARILGNHTHIFMPGETHFFDDIYSKRKKLGNPSNPRTMETIINRLANIYDKYNEPFDQKRIDLLFKNENLINLFKQTCKSYKDIFTNFMEMQMRYEGKNRWGNNVPRDVFNIKDIVEFYPNAKTIICIRDVRDFLLSYKFKWRITREENVARLKRLYNPVVTSLLWKSSLRMIGLAESIINFENLMIVRYEDLVKDPQKTVEKLCNFIGETFEPDMLNIDSSNSSFADARNGIFSTSIERWTTSLSSEEAYIGQALARNELLRYGYKIVKIQKNHLKLYMIIMSSLIRTPALIFATMHRRGNFISYLTRRIKNIL